MIFTEKLVIPSADVGAGNPLPDIKNNTYIHAPIEVEDGVKSELPNIGKGMIPTMLPYLTQDGYTREKKDTEMTAVVLENEYLRAEFLPALGGRLRRLYDKEANRELLYVNPVIQPCNLALRNAWFSGGVEFNVGIKGHNPLTCSPVFAEKRVDADGNEYVSFYEYERIRGVVWSVNAYLPDGAKALTLRCCIENTSDDEKYMYWWSNIAVEEKKDIRVIVPTDEAYINYFGNDSYILKKDKLPNARGTDISYPQNSTRSLDFFYKIQKENKKWIAAVDKEGKGLLHFSDNRLIGRKLFVWGNCVGGRHWAEYLSVENSSYIEIQAGLASTQLEHFPMSPKSKIEWVECYAALNCSLDAVHGEWSDARSAVEEQLEIITGGKAICAPELCDADLLKDSEVLYKGSAWGGLQLKAVGKPISDYFDNWESDDTSADDFKYLLENGEFPYHSCIDAPCGYVCGEFWRRKISDSLASAGVGNYLSYLHLGVVLYELGCKGDKAALAACEDAWLASAEICPNPWAYRNLAAFNANELRNYENAVEFAVKALMMKPDERALAIDCAQILLAAGCNALWVELYDKLPRSVKSIGRVRLLAAKAMLELDMLEDAGEIINENFEMPDIKEGEVSISALWFELTAKQNNISVDEAMARFKLPYSLDFRMH